MPVIILQLHQATFGVTTPPGEGGDDCSGGDDSGEWATVKRSTGISGSDRPPGSVWIKTRGDLAAACGSGGTAVDNELVCWEEYVVIEISYDGGLTWQTYWSGWGTVCDFAA
jgi:hypothetical protein